MSSGVTVMRFVPTGATPRMLVPVTTTCSVGSAGWDGWAAAIEAPPCTAAMIANTELPRFSGERVFMPSPFWTNGPPPGTRAPLGLFCACTGRRSRQGPHQCAKLIFKRRGGADTKERGPAMLARAPPVAQTIGPGGTATGNRTQTAYLAATFSLMV